MRPAGGDLYFDEDKAFYKAVHGGKVRGQLTALLHFVLLHFEAPRLAPASSGVVQTCS